MLGRTGEGARLHVYLLHPVIIRSPATFRRNPRDDLVGVVNVAGFAVHAIGGIQADAFAVRRRTVINHLVDIGRAEILARAPEFLNAALLADAGVVNDEVRWLILLVLRARMVKVSQLVERELSIAFIGAK